LIDKGYDIENGARPLKRTIQNMIETPLANGILAGDFSAGDTVSAIKDGSSLKLVSISRNKQRKSATKKQ